MEALKNNVGRPMEDNLERVDLRESIKDFKFTNKLREVFKHWTEIVEAKAKGHTKKVKPSKQWQEKRNLAFKGKAPKRFVTYNKYIANFEALYGEIIDKYETLEKSDQDRIFEVKCPIAFIYGKTNLKLAEVFPNEEDNKEFNSILLTTSFNK